MLEVFERVYFLGIYCLSKIFPRRIYHSNIGDICHKILTDLTNFADLYKCCADIDDVSSMTNYYLKRICTNLNKNLISLRRC